MTGTEWTECVHGVSLKQKCAQCDAAGDEFDYVSPQSKSKTIGYLVQWKPIETAPSSGKIFICWHNPQEPDGMDDIDIADGFGEQAYWNSNGNLVRRTPGRLWPTHWAAIPPCHPNTSSDAA